jgi:NADPH-dependent glutamate synthase beta subunit-like oxidoreductase
MAKVVKKKKKKRGLGGFAVGTAGKIESPLRPKGVPKRPPCSDNCPNHNPIRKMLVTIQKAEDHGKSYEQAFEEAFYIFLDKTPFPSICGRVCPHPCETECNRKQKEGAVRINKVERFIGDYGLEKDLKPKMLTDRPKSEKIAIVGSGPAGVSSAYQLARRGYKVTIFEAFPKTGGMLRYGIPDYRLPQDILDAEINRVLDMGVELKLNASVGNDVSMEDLKNEYNAIFIAIGAHKGLKLRVEGEEAPNVYSGVEFLNKVNRGERVEVGGNVVVVGGGDTAVDAARVAVRMGAKSTILYRRTREEMPAIDEEIEGALAEGIEIHYLAAPIEIYKENGQAVGMKCQRMELGEPDSSGRRRPVPIEGDTFELNFTTLIPAISQEPDFNGFEDLIEGRDWIKIDEKFKTKIDGLYSGGDDTNLGLVIDAIFHGRRAADAIHEKLSSEPMPIELPKDEKVIRFDKMQMSYYEKSEPVAIKEVPVEDRLKNPDIEIISTMPEEDAVHEAKRCMSCGYCFECAACWSYCQDNAVIKPLKKGEVYTFKLEFCTGCKKCAENCPCGYIEMF